MRSHIKNASKVSRWACMLLFVNATTGHCVGDENSLASLAPPAPEEGTIRVATFNVALNRKEAGQLVKDLNKGDEQAKKIAAIVQAVRPDVLLANEVDYSEGKAAVNLLKNYFGVPQLSLAKSDLQFLYTGPVNTGVPSGLDLNLNGRNTDSDDAWGYGAFPGQYGMAVYSKFPINTSDVRSFQSLKWHTMPSALRPKLTDKETGKERFFHSDEVWEKLRLSSKSHWDVPIQIEGKVFHLIASHPTPPVFDGPEDRNGCRNHDEIRLLREYVEGGSNTEYIVDDNGKSGALSEDSFFTIVGDLNADPNDGSGLSSAITELLASKRVNSKFVPASQGAVEAAKSQGKANEKHKGDPSHDTGDFNDNNPGNLRIDFVLPSSNCEVVSGGVFWPTSEQLQKVGLAPDWIEASDHHLVWLDIKMR